ncbi:MAG TPA: diguanylate cyclase, partial [Anaerolineales bacterium]|nr:diguanylate cyclase [Anaerolineales bacterium]
PLEVGLSPLETADGFQMLVSIMDITERKRAETTRQHLLEISQAALSAGSPAEIMERTMNILRASVPFDHAGLRFVDEKAKVLRFVCSVGSIEVNKLTREWEIPLGQGIASTVIQTGIPECVNHAHLDPRTIYAPGFVIKHEHALCLPLCAGEVNFGVLFVARYSDPPFSEQEFEEAKMFLSHVTLAVYNAHLRQIDQARLEELESLYTQIQTQKTLLEERVAARTAELHIEIAERKHIEETLRLHVGHLSTLHQITLELIQQHNIEELLQNIVNQVSKMLDVDWGILTLKEGEYLVDRVQLQNARISYELIASRREEDPLSPIWQVLDTAKPLIVDDYSSLPNIRPQTAALGISAAILLPIFIGDTCQGILGTGRVRPGKMFTEEEIQFGTLLARIAGIILGNAYLHETLRQEAIRDPLTNLYNRRFMEESLSREIQRAERDQHPLTVAMLDIDHFKIFNDTYGHNVGDFVLQVLGEILQKNFRGGDIACRYGGEEFVLILPGTRAEAIAVHLETLRNEISSRIVEFEGQRLPSITISGGLAEASPEVSTAEKLLKKADIALYRAKSEGRNRIVIA